MVFGDVKQTEIRRNNTGLGPSRIVRRATSHGAFLGLLGKAPEVGEGGALLRSLHYCCDWVLWTRDEEGRRGGLRVDSCHHQAQHCKALHIPKREKVADPGTGEILL